MEKRCQSKIYRLVENIGFQEATHYQRQPDTQIKALQMEGIDRRPRISDTAKGNDTEDNAQAFHFKGVSGLVLHGHLE